MFPPEFSNVPFKRGIVGMARAADPGSANAQFFIMYADGPFLDGKYTVIGEVVSGMETVDKIKKGPSQDNGKVTNPDRIVRMRVASERVRSLFRSPSYPQGLTRRHQEISMRAVLHRIHCNVSRFCCGAAQAEKKVALVIGNDRYANLPVLQKAVNDAEAVGNTLARLGFDVIRGRNLGRQGHDRQARRVHRAD